MKVDVAIAIDVDVAGLAKTLSRSVPQMVRDYSSRSHGRKQLLLPFPVTLAAALFTTLFSASHEQVSFRFDPVSDWTCGSFLVRKTLER